MVARLMVIRMPVGMIPDNRDTYLCEGTVITPSYRVIPRTIIRCQIQVVFLDIVLQPIAESRVRLCVEINHMGRLRLVIVTADHIEIQISFHVLYLWKRLNEGFRSEKPFLLTVPESEYNGSLRLLARGKESPRYLQNGRDSGGVIVRPVIDLVAIQHRVDTQMVIVSADDHDLTRVLALYLTQDIIQGKFLENTGLLDSRYGIRLHLPAGPSLLAFHMVSLKRMVIRVSYRVDTQ